MPLKSEYYLLLEKGEINDWEYLSDTWEAFGVLIMVYVIVLVWGYMRVHFTRLLCLRCLLYIKAEILKVYLDIWVWNSEKSSLGYKLESL